LNGMTRGFDSTHPLPRQAGRARAGRSRSWPGLPTLALVFGALLLAACGGRDGEHAVPPDSPLLDPQGEGFMASAPDTFNVRFTTSKGDFVVEVISDWAPNGADRFYNLVRHGFYDGTRFFRALDGFMVQFGLHGDPAVTDAWQTERIMDDPVRQSNERGNVSFAMAGQDTRTTQIFINLADNPQLDEMGFAPIGRVIEGMDVVAQLHTGYGEGPPRGAGPNQVRLRAEGNAYLAREFPELDHVERAVVEAERRTQVQ
jgi:cyclophilin family peptidyl-prolyl cis-trans isomerase